MINQHVKRPTGYKMMTRAMAYERQADQLMNYEIQWSTRSYHGAWWCFMISINHHDSSWPIVMRHDSSWSLMINHDPSWIISIHEDFACYIMNKSELPSLIMIHHDLSRSIIAHHDPPWLIRIHIDHLWSIKNHNVLSWSTMTDHDSSLLVHACSLTFSITLQWLPLAFLLTFPLLVHACSSIFPQLIHDTWLSNDYPSAFPSCLCWMSEFDP